MQVVEIPLLGQGGVTRSAGVVRLWRFHNSDRSAIGNYSLCPGGGGRLVGNRMLLKEGVWELIIRYLTSGFIHRPCNARLMIATEISQIDHQRPLRIRSEPPV